MCVYYLFIVSDSMDRRDARISALEADLSTYCTEPVDKDNFIKWKESFSLEAMTADISRILADKEKVRECHAKLGRHGGNTW